ncbi:MAG: sensor histidine kinase, partial [Deltaproteobacteria bacterium]|nr:sensor histidine kinase [Deltaproteobacteria bacterium]
VAEHARRGELAERNAELTALGASLERQVAERTRSLADAVARLERSEAELRELARAASGAREAESARISRELHDELGQLLTGLKISSGVHARRLRRGGHAEGAVEAERLTAIVDDSLQSVRRVSRELRPAMLDDIGLGAALEWMVAGYTDRTGIAARVELLDEALDLDPEQRTALFRVAQEALTNAARHAAATTVTLRLERRDGALSLTIEDDGVGMPAAGGTPGLGLSGMRERARAIGASLDISPGGARGARVTLVLPMPRAA